MTEEERSKDTIEPLEDILPSTEEDEFSSPYEAHLSEEARRSKGFVAWMTKNSIAANLFMFVLLFGGFLGVLRTKQEILPEFDVDVIAVSIPYPGASPEEVEQGIVLSVEDSIEAVDGIKRVSSSASEGVGRIYVELLLGADPNQVLNDVKSAVDRITTFPKDAEEASAKLLSLRREVVSVVLSGDQELSTLHQLAEDARSELRSDPRISTVEIAGVPARELRIEINREVLEAHGLTTGDVAQQIAADSLDLPGGGIKTAGGELLVRVADRKKTIEDYADIIIKSSFSGNELRLGDVATIVDGYEETDQASYYNGKRAVRLVAYRVGAETPTEVAAATKDILNRLKERLPASVDVSIWQDQSELLKGRIDLLMNNAKIGLLLVFGVLALFLEFRLAFWVALGIPISFLGSFLLLPQTGATINMVSLFAYIVTLGIVVDDAIVVGENIFEERSKGKDWLTAAVTGARKMVVPVTFAVLTTIAAFAPLLFVPGVSGKFFKLIPTVVICVLILSLIESFFVLPAHLAHIKDKEPGAVLRFLDTPRRVVSGLLERFTQGSFHKVVDFAVNNRYLTVGIAVACFILSIGLVASRRVPFRFFPALEGEVVTASVRLPYGAPSAKTREVSQILEEAAQRAIVDAGGSEGLVRGIFTSVGEGPEGRAGRPQGSHLVTVQTSLIPSEQRELSSEEFSALWQKQVPELAGIEVLSFSSQAQGPGAGAAVNVQLTSKDLKVLEEAAAEMADLLRGYQSLRDIDNSFATGKPQLDYAILPEGRALGLTSADVARQIRGAIFGSEALREQVGRLERKTTVRLPKEQRSSEADLQQMRIRTPMGGYVPLEQVASLTRGFAPTSISREEGRRKVNVKAELAPGARSAQEVLAILQKETFPDFKARYPKLDISLAGEQRDQGETFASLGPNYLLALFAIYALLAIPFRSYTQPLIIMSAIPFGVVGAILGHMIMAYELSIMSMFGIIALSGVVVNDSLVLIDATNKFRQQGHSALEAIVMGSKRRLRPILLTSFTTFFGLVPMVAETSVQAKFLIPMAISLSFGVMFATFVILLVVPALYIILEDLLSLFKRGEEKASVDDSTLETAV
ncbi:MAG: cobalt-zinc-cadmium resistance protein [Proteobacteria bacterium]|nr:cobalt-zinc-cadmium resistance protein [Pseudomonadota bacterium]